MATKMVICGFLLKRIFKIKIVVAFFGRGAFSKLKQTFYWQRYLLLRFSLTFSLFMILIILFYGLGSIFKVDRPFWLLLFIFSIALFEDWIFKNQNQEKISSSLFTKDHDSFKIKIKIKISRKLFIFFLMGPPHVSASSF